MKPSRLDDLRAHGWTRRFTACEPRLSEAAAAYEEAGFEILLAPLSPKAEGDPRAGGAENGECRMCFTGSGDRYRTLFTRRRNGPRAGSEKDGDLPG